MLTDDQLLDVIASPSTHLCQCVGQWDGDSINYWRQLSHLLSLRACYKGKVQNKTRNSTLSLSIFVLIHIVPVHLVLVHLVLVHLVLVHLILVHLVLVHFVFVHWSYNVCWLWVDFVGMVGLCG